MLTHENYLDTLQTLNSTTAEWSSVLAGFLVLRLADAWLDDDPSVVTRDLTGIQAVREALSHVRERDPVRPILSELVDVITQSERVSVEAIVAPLFKYGQVLHYTNFWHLALDVFASVLSHAQAEQEHLTIARAASRVGFVLRWLGHTDASGNAYQIAIQEALYIDNPQIYFKARSGMGWNFAFSGRVAQAETIFNTVATEAKARGLTEIQATALHNLSGAAFLRQDYLAALRIGRKALKHMSDSKAQIRLLTNIGSAFIGFDEHSAARKILLPILEHTAEEVIRQKIMINLLEVAAKEVDRPTFDRYQRDLHGTIVIPELEAHYHLYLGKGYYNFRNMGLARESWHNALAISEANGLKQISTVIRADIAATTQHTT